MTACRSPYEVVIVGVGAAGALTAANLLTRWPAGVPLRLTLLERSGRYGPGVAYATPDAQHLLNVSARGMSAYPDRSGHFAAWARLRSLTDDDDVFAPRAAYGAYLAEQLDDAERAAGAGVVVRRDEMAVAIEDGPAGLVVQLAGGGALRADVVVLATGVSRPAPPAAVDAAIAAHPGCVADPWVHARLAALRAARRVVIVGTGLTMVDVALSLCPGDAGPEVVAISRGGLLPRAHRDGGGAVVPPVVQPGEASSAAELVARMEAAARGMRDWRVAVDSLRPVTQALWRSLPADERERFARLHARRWEVHRHRMAPAVAGRIRTLRAAGRLRVLAGTIDAVAAADARAVLSACGAAQRAGGGGVAMAAADERECGDSRLVVCAAGERIVADAVVLATGPDLDLRRSRDPLLRSLLDAGLAAPGPLGLGLRTRTDGALVGADGRCHGSLFTLGALRRGELWETTSIPEIRAQAAALAATIARRADARAAA